MSLLIFAAARFYFNPRSLAGATHQLYGFATNIDISIHAPSRERHGAYIVAALLEQFQSTLPRGSDCWFS